jgi:hypothetical protein
VTKASARGTKAPRPIVTAIRPIGTNLTSVFNKVGNAF